MENLGIIIGLIAIAVTMVIGFLGIMVMIVQSTNQTRAEIKEVRNEIKEVRVEIKEVETKLGDEIKEVRDDIKATNAKIDTLLLGLFRSYLPEQPPQKQDKAS